MKKHKRVDITISFGIHGPRTINAVSVSSRMAVHQSVNKDVSPLGTFRVSDPVSGYGWPYDFKSEARAIAWAEAFTKEFGDDPMPDAKVHGTKSAWRKKPARHKEIGAWIKTHPPSAIT